MIKSFLFQMCLLSFILIHLLNSGNCIVTEEDLNQIRNELNTPDSLNVDSSKVYDIINKNDKNDLKTVREIVNERLKSDDMSIKLNTLRSCYLIHNKLQNTEECVRALIDILKDDRYREYQYGHIKFMGFFSFTENDVKELLEISPAVKERVGDQYWELYIGSIASSGGEKAYEPIIKYYNLDNATTETLIKYDWLLIKTGDMRSVNRVLQKVESMPLDTLRYSRELGGLIGTISRKVRNERNDENMLLYNRCLKLMDKITSNESSHQRYVQIVCMVYSGMLLDPENRQFALEKLEELRPIWKETYYAKHIEYEIDKVKSKIKESK